MRPPLSRRRYLALLGTSVTAGCFSSNCSTIESVTGTWLQAGHDATHTGHAPEASGPKSAKVGGEIDLNGGAVRDIHIAVGGSNVVVGGERVIDGKRKGVLRGLNIRNGSVTWEVRPAGPVAGVPAIVDNRVFVTSRPGINRGVIQAFDTGENELWRHSIDARLTVPPTVAGDTVYVGAGDGTILALAQADGAVRWQRRVGDERQGMEITYAPTVRDGRVVVAGQSSAERGIHVLDATDGSHRWRVPGPLLGATPAIRDGTIVTSFGRHAGEIVALNLHDGSHRWSVTVGESRLSPPTVTTDTVYVIDRSHIYSLALVDGNENWRTEVATNPSYRPTAGEKAIYVVGSGSITAYQQSTGERRWRFDSEARTPAIPAGGTVVCGQSEGRITALTSCAD